MSASGLSRYGSLICSLVLVLSVVSLGSAQAPSFPTLPSSYSATVVASFRNRNYTLAYEEFFDGDQQLLKTNGRFGGSDHSEILDFNSNVSSIFLQGSSALTDQSCNHSRFDSSMIRQLSPSSHFFVDFIITPRASIVIEYAGQPPKEQTRYLQCDEWRGYNPTFRMGNSTLSMNFSYYAATTAIQGIERAPVRMFVTGTRTDLTDPNNPVSYYFEHTYDWVKFSYVKPAPFRFIRPAYCPPLPADLSTLPSRARGFMALPTDTLAPAPLPTSFPTLPTKFKMTLEAKLDDSQHATSSNPNPPPYVAAYTWWKDDTDSEDRLDLQVLTNATNDVGDSTLIGEGQRIRIQKRDSSAVGGATVWTYDSTATNGASATCTTEALTLDNLSPLDYRRAGSLQNLFSLNPPDSFKSPDFIQRTTLRGVEVDQWRMYHQKFNGDSFFTWTMDVFLTVAGWRFPGRQGVEDVSIPMRVINNGSWVNSSITTPQPYVDVYDFFLILPEAATDQYFAFDQFANVTCPPAPTLPADAVFPDIPQSYQVHVDAVMTNRGYSYSFKESFDGVDNIVRTDGINGTTINNLNTNTSTQYPSDFSSCVTFPLLTTGGGGALSKPVVHFFSDYASLFTGKNYVGRFRDLDGRFILADHWIATTGFALRNSFSNFTIRFYASVPSSGLKAAPLRIQIGGVSYQLDPTTKQPVPNTARVFEHVYDFIQFATLDMTTVDPTLFNPSSAVCTSMATPSRFFGNGTLPRDRSGLAAEVTAAPFPTFPAPPNLFSTILELKFIRGGNYETNVIEWTIDRTNGVERVEIVSASVAGVTPAAQILSYNTFPNNGVVYSRGTDGTCSMSNFNAGSAVAPAMSVFSAARTALVLDLYSSSALLYQQPRTYVFDADRGVTCDRYTGSRVNDVTTGARFLNYTSEVFVNVQGWAFVDGDPAKDRTLQLPLRLNLAGFEADDLGNEAPFSGTVDLYHTRLTPPSSAFSPSVMCSNYLALMNGAANEDDGFQNENGSVIAGAIIVAVIIVIGAIVLVTCIVRRLRQGREGKARSPDASSGAGGRGGRDEGDQIIHTRGFGEERPNSDRARMSHIASDLQPVRLHDIDVASPSEDQIELQSMEEEDE